MTTTFDVSGEGMKIAMPEPQRHEFINHMSDLFAQAIAFTEQCCDLLVEERGAIRDDIEPCQFYYKYCGQLIEHNISGKPITTVRETVAWAVANVNPAYLGLAEPGRHDTAIRRGQEEFRQTIQQYKPPV